MVFKKTFIRGQDQEGLRWKEIVDKDGNPVSFAGCSQIKFYCFTQDHVNLLFQGTLGSEITVTGANSNNIEWAPNPSDCDQDPDVYKGQLWATHSTGRVQKIGELLIEIIDEAPTS